MNIEDLSICDDHELMIRTYMVTKMHHVKKPLYIYRVTGDNTWLERNENIQTETVRLFNENAYALAERDANLRGLLKVDMGGGLFPRPGYLTIDQEGADITCDLNEGIPLQDNSVGILNASHVIEHLRDPIKTMREIHRVLAHGGWAMIEVPSTDGRGAWQDPTHVSFWNEHSFWYYTDINEKPTKILSTSLIGWSDQNIKKAVIWLSIKKNKPILLLTDDDYNENGMGGIFEKYES